MVMFPQACKPIESGDSVLDLERWAEGGFLKGWKHILTTAASEQPLDTGSISGRRSENQFEREIFE